MRPLNLSLMNLPLNLPLNLPSRWIKVLLMVLLGMVAAGSFFYNQTLIRELNEKERNAVELWAKALEFSNNPALAGEDAGATGAGELAAQQFVIEELILGTRHEIPTIVTDASGEIIQFRFLEEREVRPALIDEYAAVNEPITIEFGEGEQRQTQVIYFGESDTIRFLRVVPYVQFSILTLLIGIGVVTFRSISRAEQSNLWVGMAKEAAHQLGTPLSSLYGWVQLLKDTAGPGLSDESSGGNTGGRLGTSSSEGVDGDSGGSTDENSGTPVPTPSTVSKEDLLRYIYEAENDVSRIETVAERFNKIGSSPELKETRLDPIIRRVVEYMERRTPQLGRDAVIRTRTDISRPVALNAQLFQWALENLIKNAMDALPSGTKDNQIEIHAFEQASQLVIDVTDNGSGIPKSAVSQVFKPGYSTKKRGWGLGLSLTRRIIETYHNGKITVHKTSPGQGTTFRIQLPFSV